MGGNINIGLKIEKSGEGFHLTSPDVSHFAIYLKEATIGDMLQTLKPVLTFRLLQEGISVRNVMVVLDGQSDELNSDQSIDTSLFYRAVIVPNMNPRRSFPSPSI